VKKLNRTQPLSIKLSIEERYKLEVVADHNDEPMINVLVRGVDVQYEEMKDSENEQQYKELDK